MKLAVFVVGRLKDKYLEDGINDYLKRIRRYGKCDIVRIKEEKKSKKQSEADAIQKEADHILAQLKPNDHLIALTEEGELLDSPALSSWLDTLAMHTPGRLVFVIGSGPGLAPSLKQQANSLLSLSPLTLPHQMALLVLLEQLYRAYTISHGEPYHR